METTGKRPFSLYFHIPFCTKKCPYCHFYVIRDNENQKDELLECFFKELSLLEISQDFELKSIYFGGGTPSLFGPTRIESVLRYIQQKIIPIESSCEITLEANPEDVTFERFLAFQKAGITRVSLGVQSLHDPSLLQIGRTHSASKAIDAIWSVYNAGITNISIDLMYDRPGQNLEDWQYELSLLKTLPVSHLSLYNMTIEEGSAYKRKEVKIKSMMPDHELSLKLHQTALEELKKAGFERYEISAFCKDGKRSIHNLGYWQGREFYGLGPSAFSYFNKKRFKNFSNFKFYQQSLAKCQLAYDFEETLSLSDAYKEMFCIGLRVKEGIDLSELGKKYGPMPIHFLTEIEQLIQKGYLKKQGSVIQLTELGMLFYDDVGSALI